MVFQKLLAKTPLRFAPGSRWAYSTAGMDLLGRVVEVVGGMPFDQFMQNLWRVDSLKFRSVRTS